MLRTRIIQKYPGHAIFFAAMCGACSTSGDIPASFHRRHEFFQRPHVLQRGPCVYPVAGKPSPSHFKRVTRAFDSPVDLLAPRQHVNDLHDAAIVRDEGDGQRDEGILHPEIMPPDLGKDEQQPAVLAYLLAVHQPLSARRWSIDYLSLDGIRADPQLHNDRRRTCRKRYAQQGQYYDEPAQLKPPVMQT